MAGAWPTASYLQQALRLYYHCDELQVGSVDHESLWPPMQRNDAILTPIKVTYSFGIGKMEIVNYLIAKTEKRYVDRNAQEIMAPYDIFNRELEIYENVMPRLQELAGEQLCPKIYYIDRKTKTVIIEDMSKCGYMLAPSLTQLDELHLQVVLEKLAKMQAASVVMQEDTGSLNRFDRGFFNQYTEGYKPYFVGCLKACAEYLKSQPGYAESAFLLNQLAPDYMALGLQCFRPEENQVNVLTHGDLSTNNMMFKYEKNKPIDVLLIDFHYAFWGSPTLDIHHLINTSATESVRTSKQMEMRCLYYETFKTQIMRLTGKCPSSLKKFHLASEQKRFYAVHCALILQPVLLYTDDIDQLTKALLWDQERGTRMKRLLYRNKAIQDSVKMLVKQFELEGLLDPEQYV